MRISRKVGALLVLMFLSIGAFASPKLDSDFQVYLGFMALRATTETSKLNEMILKMTDNDNDDYTGITARGENYNLFEINPVLSVGIFENVMYGKLQDSWTVESMAGPAVGIKLGSLVKFQLSGGIDVGWRHAEKTIGTIYIPGLMPYPVNQGTMKDGNWMYGFGFGLQAKVLPENFISPVVGAHFMHAYCRIFDNDTYTNAIEVYAGASFNF